MNFTLLCTTQAGLIDGGKRDDLLTTEENVKSLIAKGKGYEIEAWEVSLANMFIFKMSTHVMCTCRHTLEHFLEMG